MRLQQTLQNIQSALTAPLQRFLVFCPVNGLASDGLPSQVGNVEFAVFGDAQLGRLRAAVATHKVDQERGRAAGDRRAHRLGAEPARPQRHAEAEKEQVGREHRVDAPRPRQRGDQPGRRIAQRPPARRARPRRPARWRRPIPAGGRRRSSWPGGRTRESRRPGAARRRTCVRRAGQERAPTSQAATTRTTRPRLALARHRGPTYHAIGRAHAPVRLTSAAGMRFNRRGGSTIDETPDPARRRARLSLALAMLAVGCKGKDSAPDCKAVAASYATLQRKEIEKPTGTAANSTSETARQEAASRRAGAQPHPAAQGGDGRGVPAEEVDGGDAALRGRREAPEIWSAAARARRSGEGAGEAPAGRRGRPGQSARNRTAAPEIRLSVTLARAPGALHSRAMKFDYPHTLDKEDARARWPSSATTCTTATGSRSSGRATRAASAASTWSSRSRESWSSARASST